MSVPELGRRTSAVGATFSADRRYRYRLWRRWSADPSVAFVMLNPSTADERGDDPTIRRCVAFARRWGFGGVEIVNLFALRASDPRLLGRSNDPVGPANDRHIARVAARATLVVIAWGVWGRLRGRSAKARARLSRRAPRCLGLTRSGEPRHPLYLRADARLVRARSGQRSSA